MARALILAVAFLALAAPAAEAASSYCSPSGDVCKEVRKRDGRWTFAITTAALYAPGTRYRLCVRDPAGDETCRSFRLRRGRFGSYASTVRWSAHFPVDGPRGRHRVRWDHAGTTYGPALTFVR